MNSIGIIGGGITGLTLAYRLARAGATFTLYESSSRVGGPIHSIHKDGFLVEAGPNTLLESSQEVASLVHDLGLDSHKIYPSNVSRKRYILKNGKTLAMPLSPGQFIGTDLFSFGAKVRLLGEPFRGRSTNPNEESVASFVRRRLGKEFLEYGMDPFVSGIYAGDVEKLSMRYSFPKLFSLEEKHGSIIKGQIKGLKDTKRSKLPNTASTRMYSFDEGLGALTDKLYHKIEEHVKLSAHVTRLEQLPQGWNIYYSHNGTEYISTHEKIVLTLPAYKIAELSHNIDSVDFSSLSEIYYPPLVSIALGFKREDVGHTLDGFGALVPSVEKRNILGALFNSSLFPDRAPSEKVLLTNFIGGVRNPDITQRSESEQVELVLKDLRDILAVKNDPIFIHRSYFAHAIPQYELGFGRYLETMSSIESKADGLFFAGNFRNGISLGDCISRASFLAEKLTGK
ncbi:MAG: protoporphyrinogen oxidase [bacterium]